jgi:hypothetical protein
MTTTTPLIRLSSLLALLLAAVLAVPISAGATASDALLRPGAAAEPPTLISHLRSELQQSDPARRDHALVDVISLANCPASCTVALQSTDRKKVTIANETEKGAVMDLSTLTPALIDVYRDGPADGHRLLALSALLKIGNEQAIDRLVDESALQSESVAHSTHRGLAAFYLAKYPELEAKTMQRGRLSLEDVQRARALHLKRQAEK